MAKEEGMKFDGVVLEQLGNAMFKVRLNESEHTITAYIGGKMRKNQIRIIEGDRVSVEMSPYDLGKGRIIYRTK